MQKEMMDNVFTVDTIQIVCPIPQKTCYPNQKQALSSYNQPD